MYFYLYVKRFRNLKTNINIRERTVMRGKVNLVLMMIDFKLTLVCIIKFCHVLEARSMKLLVNQFVKKKMEVKVL